jgi:hypothetical protein
VTDLNILATSRNMVFRFIFFHPFVADFPRETLADELP